MTPARADVYDADVPDIGRHPVVILTRNEAIPVLRSIVAALVTSTVRGHRAEVPVGPAEGLDGDCVINCDNVLLIRKAWLARRRGRLGPERQAQLNAAVRFALDL